MARESRDSYALHSAVIHSVDEWLWRMVACSGGAEMVFKIRLGCGALCSFAWRKGGIL
jgi:hypothetical protein